MTAPFARYPSLLLPVFLCVQSSGAQEKPEPPSHRMKFDQPETDSVAQKAPPKISLPEFEIRGEEVLQLDPGSKRVADDRWHMRNTTLGDEEYDEAGSRLSLGELRSAGRSAEPQGITGRAYAGYGSFQTPELGLWLGAASPGFGILLKTEYRSTSGHVENADGKSGSASLSLSHPLGSRSLVPGEAFLNGSIGFSGRAFRLYGSVLPSLQRSAESFDALISLASEVDPSFAYDADLSVAGFSVVDTIESTERELEFRLGAEKRAGKTVISGSIDGWRDFFSATSSSQDPFITQLAGDLRRRISPVVTVKGGFSLYYLRGSARESSWIVYPRVGVSWQAAPALGLSVGYSPFVEKGTLRTLFQRNPYLWNDTELQHQQYSTNLELAADFDPASSWRARVALRYQRATHIPLFIERSGIASEGDGTWGVDYSGTTRIFGLNAELSTDVSRDANLLISFAWQDVANSATGHPIPYSPGFQVGGTYRQRFEAGITLQADLHVFGPQYTDTDAVGSLPAYFLVDLLGEYGVMKGLVIGVSLRNLFDQDQELWRGYEGVPRTISVTGRYTW